MAVMDMLHRHGDRFVNVIVVEGVENVLTDTAGADQSLVAQDLQLVGDRAVCHAECRRDTARADLPFALSLAVRADSRQYADNTQFGRVADRAQKPRRFCQLFLRRQQLRRWRRQQPQPQLRGCLEL